MYVTEETATCCNRWYSRTVGRAGWTKCHDCKQPLFYQATRPGKLISPDELRERQRNDSRRRRELKEREKTAAREARAEQRAARQAQEVRDRYPLFAEEFLRTDHL